MRLLLLQRRGVGGRPARSSWTDSMLMSASTDRWVAMVRLWPIWRYRARGLGIRGVSGISRRTWSD